MHKKFWEELIPYFLLCDKDRMKKKQKKNLGGGDRYTQR
jgi:hypothetical protein